MKRDVARDRCADVATQSLQDSRTIVTNAFAEVPRGTCLFPLPWSVIHSASRYSATNTDLVTTYDHPIVPIGGARNGTWGRSNSHGQLLALLRLRRGNPVLHAGAGRGYYAAILASLIELAGCFVTDELDSDDAMTASISLPTWAHATIVSANGTGLLAGVVDGICVDFAVADLTHRWLDTIALGGTLVPRIASALENSEPGGARVRRLRIKCKATCNPSRFYLHVSLVAAAGSFAGRPDLRCR